MNLATQSFTTAITAVASSPIIGLDGMEGVSLLCLFTYVAASATSVDVYVQTSLDGGTTWYDIANFHFTTAGAVKNSNVDGTTTVATATPTIDTLASNTVANGLLGDRIRMVVTTVGTYGVGSQVQTWYAARGT